MKYSTQPHRTPDASTRALSPPRHSQCKHDSLTNHGIIRVINHQCLDSETLACYLNGEMEAGEMRFVDQHLLQCERCAMIADGLNPIDEITFGFTAPVTDDYVDDARLQQAIRNITDDHRDTQPQSPTSSVANQPPFDPSLPSDISDDQSSLSPERVSPGRYRLPIICLALLSTLAATYYVVKRNIGPVTKRDTSQLAPGAKPPANDSNPKPRNENTKASVIANSGSTHRFKPSESSLVTPEISAFQLWWQGMTDPPGFELEGQVDGRPTIISNQSDWPEQEFIVTGVYFDTRRGRRATDRDWKEFLDADLPRFEAVGVRGQALPSPWIESLANVYPFVRSIVCGQSLSEDAIGSLAAMPNLTMLDVGGAMDDRRLKQICTMKNLMVLHIDTEDTDWRVSTDQFRELASTQITVLTLRRLTPPIPVDELRSLLPNCTISCRDANGRMRAFHPR